MRHFIRTLYDYAFAAAVVAVLCVTVSMPALAQDTAPIDTGSSIANTILTAIAAALPGILLGGWALFVAYAAKSEATWDDWIVARVKDVARGVLEEGNPPAPPASTTTKST